MAGRAEEAYSSSPGTAPSSLLGARNPQLSLDLTGAGPPPPALVFHPAEPDSQPQSPASPASPSRSRIIRFKSRVHIASSSRPRHSYGNTSGTRTRSASPESRRATSTASDSDSDAASDSSSLSAPLRDDTHRSVHEPPSPMPNLPHAAAQEQQPTATYVVLGPAYGWSEHTPLIPKGFLRPQRPRGSSSHYGSDAELNAELARAQAAAKRTEEDVRCSQMKHGWLSYQWWWWKMRQELFCCCADDDDEYE